MSYAYLLPLMDIKIENNIHHYESYFSPSSPSLNKIDVPTY
jgi:hypothetical protein